MNYSGATLEPVALQVASKVLLKVILNFPNPEEKDGLPVGMPKT